MKINSLAYASSFEFDFDPNVTDADALRQIAGWLDGTDDARLVSVVPSVDPSNPYLALSFIVTIEGH